MFDFMSLIGGMMGGGKTFSSQYDPMGMSGQPGQNIKKTDGGFYGHMTHKSIQKNEESVKVSGDGFHDSSVPKTPKTDCFYNNVSNWKR